MNVFHHDMVRRKDIMTTIQRQNARESEILDDVIDTEVRWAIRRWYRDRWEYLLREYERRMGE